MDECATKQPAYFLWPVRESKTHNPATPWCPVKALWNGSLMSKIHLKWSQWIRLTVLMNVFSSLNVATQLLPDPCDFNKPLNYSQLVLCDPAYFFPHLCVFRIFFPHSSVISQLSVIHTNHKNIWTFQLAFVLAQCAGCGFNTFIIRFFSFFNYWTLMASTFFFLP